MTAAATVRFIRRTTVRLVTSRVVPDFPDSCGNQWNTRSTIGCAECHDPEVPRQRADRRRPRQLSPSGPAAARTGGVRRRRRGGRRRVGLEGGGRPPARRGAARRAPAGHQRLRARRPDRRPGFGSAPGRPLDVSRSASDDGAALRGRRFLAVERAQRLTDQGRARRDGVSTAAVPLAAKTDGLLASARLRWLRARGGDRRRHARRSGAVPELPRRPGLRLRQQLSTAAIAAHIAVGMSFILVGLLAWTRRPENHVGPLMTLAGFTYFVHRSRLDRDAGHVHLRRRVARPLLRRAVLAAPRSSRAGSWTRGSTGYMSSPSSRGSASCARSPQRRTSIPRSRGRSTCPRTRCSFALTPISNSTVRTGVAKPPSTSPSSP